ncbi:Sodium/calcium exchanger protein-domain-containing protein [Gongronella butleri]|nr:Sodium/calcium exchanger protein-domain-containing protein [Gongronella butleri]
MGASRTVAYGLAFLFAIYCIQWFSRPPTVTLLANSRTCSNIDQQPNQCGYVRDNCKGLVALYLEFYYCTPVWRPALLTALISGLLLLFGAISVVASDFFCPNLQTIAAKLQLSESLAGVTVLAFGNGSPDLFGTFSAMQHGSGSMAIGEIIGAAFFVVSVIAGSMGIIRPFQSKRITFMRDATFLTGAISLLSWIVYHGKIYWYHGLALIGYYLFYVITVLISSYDWPFAQKTPTDQALYSSVPVMDETTKLLGAQGKPGMRPPRLDIPVQGFSATGFEYEPHLGHIIRPTSPLSSRPSLHIETSIPYSRRPSINLPRTTSTNGSINTLRPYRRAMTPRVGIRTSLFSAIELQSQVSAIRRANSSQQMQTPVMASAIQVSPSEQQHRRRQVSMPQDIWHRHHGLATGTMPPDGGRVRAVTVTDHLRPTAPASSGDAMRATTPDSNHSSTGIAEDYFAYLSTHQPQAMLVPQPPPPLPIPIIDIQREPEMPIPEIRLAPPLLEQYHTPQTSALTPNPQGSTSLHVMTPSPSIASSTDYDCFVSARQSPELNPVHIVSASNASDAGTPRPTALSHPQQMPCMPCLDDSSFHDITQQQDLKPPLLLTDIVDELAPPVSLPSPWRFYLQQFAQVMFPTLQEWADKSWFSRFSSVVATPLVLVFIITLPVAEAEDTKIDDVKVMVGDNDGMVGEDDDDDDEAMMSSHPPPSAFTTNTKYLSFSSVQGQLLPPLEPPIMTTHKSSSFLTVPRSDSDAHLNHSAHTFPNTSPSIPMATSATNVQVVEEDLRQGWCKWLLALQCFGTTFFLCSVAILNGWLQLAHLGVCAIVGAILCGLVLRYTHADEPPSWFWLLSFGGFVVSLNWIFLLADAMVGMLQALGKIFVISEAIMGLTVFAFGNSVGDLVSNTAIAKMGFPTMAISACYAGPLLNMVLGVGVSSTFQIWKAHGQPYPLVIPPTILISAGGLIVVLLSTLFVVNMNGFHVTKQLGYWTISVYTFCCVVNLILEFGNLYKK